MWHELFKNVINHEGGIRSDYILREWWSNFDRRKSWNEQWYISWIMFIFKCMNSNCFDVQQLYIKNSYTLNPFFKRLEIKQNTDIIYGLILCL